MKTKKYVILIILFFVLLSAIAIFSVYLPKWFYAQEGVSSPEKVDRMLYALCANMENDANNQTRNEAAISLGNIIARWYPSFIIRYFNASSLREGKSDEVILNLWYQSLKSEIKGYEFQVKSKNISNQELHDVIAHRSNTVCNAYPISSNKTLAEQLLFMELIIFYEKHNRDDVVNCLKSELNRLDSSEKTVFLVLLKGFGVENFTDDYSSNESNEVKTLTNFFRLKSHK